VEQHSQDPQWSPDGTFVLFSGPDIGTTFRIEAAAGGREYRIPELTLARGARHVEFLPGGRAIVFLRGAIGRENLWSMDVTTGRERQLTDLPSGFDVSDFDVSPDGRDIILEQVEDQSDIVLMDLGPQ
jgi:Tol biopolymer transport system component